MTIAAGTRLGSYEITRLLGKGGMGEVWRARDTKLGREFAIKTLPEEFAKDEERLARFEREAKLLASLNHPNIAAIYGLEEDNGTRFLVLELVEGDTLAERLKRGAIPVEGISKIRGVRSVGCGQTPRRGCRRWDVMLTCKRQNSGIKTKIRGRHRESL